MRNNKETDNPAITVFMAAYNSGRFIKASIQSVIAQGFDDFELLIINDGSTDDTLAIIEKFDDPRIRVLNNNTNKGLTYTRNRGWQEAKGKYLAILDSDDIALPDRLHVQYTFMETNPDVAICGGQAIIVDENDREIGMYPVPINNEYLKEQTIFRNVFVNPSCIIRIDIIRKLGGYFDYAPAEDFELSLRILMTYRGANLGVPLIKYREHMGNASIRSGKVIEQEKRIISNIHKNLGVPITDRLVKIHHAIFLWRTEECSLYDIRELFLSLILTNRKRNIYDHSYLEALIFDRWMMLLRNHKKLISALPLYFDKILFQWRFFSWRDFRKMTKSSIKGVVTGKKV
ncbi:glycosyltransferase family 2 protein [Olivibacter sp. CPCC 100613]|uniref:glycosyltransferase family 2 protein n=1 Tax=Olivibacter sp. CPCC 100613 TaxID=3079931 RepID=UPI002FF4D77B